MKKNIFITTLLVLAFVACSPKPKAEKDMEQKTGVGITHVWIKATPAAQKNSAAFMMINNYGDAEEKLISAEFAQSDVVELHEMVYENDMMKMRKVENMVVPVKGMLELKPGGLHIMLIGLKQDLKAGEKYQLHLNFESGLKKTIEAEVKEYSHKGMSGH